MGRLLVMLLSVSRRWHTWLVSRNGYPWQAAKDRKGKTWPTEFAEGWQGSKTDNAKNAYRWTIPAGSRSPEIRFNSKGRSVDVTFELPEAMDVSLLVFDADGKLQESLLEGRLNAGLHRFSIPSEQLDAPGPRLFRLKRGDEVSSRIRGGR